MDTPHLRVLDERLERLNTGAELAAHIGHHVTIVAERGARKMRCAICDVELGHVTETPTGTAVDGSAVLVEVGRWLGGPPDELHVRIKPSELKG